MHQWWTNPLLIGIAAGVISGLSMLPQLVMIIRKKKAMDISVGMVLTLLLGLALWVYYGMLKQDVPLVATNAFSFVINALVLYFSIKYKKRKSD